MGGNAFALAVAAGQPTISTRRLTRAEYERLGRQACQDLQTHFPDAEILIAPTFDTKDSFGDIDIMLSTQQKVDLDAVAASLGARAWIDASCTRSPGCSLALRIDGARDSKSLEYSAKVAHRQRPAASLTNEEYAQIDIRCVPHEELHWHSFYNSYSDTGLILGWIVRPFGFKISGNRGLVLRLKELDAFKEAKLTVADSEGLIDLSLSLQEIMSWLQLDSDRYKRGFYNTDELYDWLDGCIVPVATTALYSDEDNARYESQRADRPVFAAYMARQLARQKARSSGMASAERADIGQQLSTLR